MYKKSRLTYLCKILHVESPQVQYIDLSGIVYVVLDRGKTYKGYADIFPGPKFEVSQRRSSTVCGFHFTLLA